MECDAWPIHVVLRELERGSGFGFAHFNDGECRCIIDGAHKNRDGIDICPEEVRHLLRRSLQSLAAAPDPRVRERFLIGLPCPRCCGVQSEEVLRRFPPLRNHTRVPATLFHHAIRWSRARLLEGIRTRGGEIFLVCSTEHDVEAIENLLGASFTSVLRVDRFRAHEEPAAFDAWVERIGWGTGLRDAKPDPRTLLLSCGIVGRPWAVRAFMSDPTSLTLCLGSYFDDVALGRVLRYVGGNRLRCERCLRMV